MLCPCGWAIRSEQLYEEQLPQGSKRAWKSEVVTWNAVPSYAHVAHQPVEPSEPWFMAVGALLLVVVAVVGSPLAYQAVLGPSRR